MVCWVTRGSLHQHVTAHQPFRTSSLTSPCKSFLQGRVVSHPEPDSFLGRRKTLYLRDIFSKIQGPSIKTRETALSLPRSCWSLSSLEPCRRKGWCGICSSLLPWLCLRNLWAFHSSWEFFSAVSITADFRWSKEWGVKSIAFHHSETTHQVLTQSQLGSKPGPRPARKYSWTFQQSLAGFQT